MTAVLSPDTPSGAYRVQRARPDSPSTASTPTRQRLDHVDLLRGLVMVIMVLDHVRGLLHRGPVRPHPDRRGPVRHPLDHPLLRADLRLPGRRQCLDRRHQAHPRRASPIPPEPRSLAHPRRAHHHHVRLVLHDSNSSGCRGAGHLGDRRLDDRPRGAHVPAARGRRGRRPDDGAWAQSPGRDRAGTIWLAGPPVARAARAGPPRGGAGAPALPARPLGRRDGAGLRRRARRLLAAPGRHAPPRVGRCGAGGGLRGAAVARLLRRSFAPAPGRRSGPARDVVPQPHQVPPPRCSTC